MSVNPSTDSTSSPQASSGPIGWQKILAAVEGLVILAGISYLVLWLKPETKPSGIEPGPVVQNGTSTAASDISGWEMYRDDDIGLELNYPGDWGIEVLPQDLPWIILRSPDGSDLSVYPEGDKSWGYGINVDDEKKVNKIEIDGLSAIRNDFYTSTGRLRLSLLNFEPPLTRWPKMALLFRFNQGGNDIRSVYERVLSNISFFETKTASFESRGYQLLDLKFTYPLEGRRFWDIEPQTRTYRNGERSLASFSGFIGEGVVRGGLVSDEGALFSLQVWPLDNKSLSDYILDYSKVGPLSSTSSVIVAGKKADRIIYITPINFKGKYYEIDDTVWVSDKENLYRFSLIYNEGDKLEENFLSIFDQILSSAKFIDEL